MVAGRSFHDIASARQSTLTRSGISVGYAENKMLSTRLLEMSNELKGIKDQLKLIAQEKWELMQEKARLEGQLKQMQEMLAT